MINEVCSRSFRNISLLNGSRHACFQDCVKTSLADWGRARSKEKRLRRRSFSHDVSNGRFQRPQALGIRFGLGTSCNSSGGQGRRGGTGEIGAWLTRLFGMLFRGRPRSFEA